LSTQEYNALSWDEPIAKAAHDITQLYLPRIHEPYLPSRWRSAAGQ